MIIYHASEDNIVIAEVTDNGLIIAEVQDAVDLIGNIGTNNCNRIIINESNLHPDFFRLKTGFAGEILQKFSNYGVRLAITGDFSKFKGQALHDFIRESNKGNQIFFLDDVESALKKLSTR